MAQEKKVERIEVFFPERDDVGPIISQTLKKDPIRTHEEALIEIYRRLRPGDPPTLDSSRSLFENMFFNPQKYDFSRVGRLKLNTKLGLKTPLDEKILHPQDFYEVIKYQLKLRKNPQNVDDIDHLGNRRVRSVGELLENQFRIGLVRMERAIKEKMSVYQEMATAMPHDLINAKPVMAAIREFFGSSQLSQFMDQTNPLSEITHKRRLSALGPGGLSRERAGFEVRDVHPTHYGRICPIETPEGPNIGLISSLSCYARINEFGFIESPYRKVKDGRVVDYVIVLNAGGNAKYKAGDVVEADELVGADGRSKKKGVEFEPYSYYLSAWEEDNYIIAQANSPLDENGRFTRRPRRRAARRRLRAGAARRVQFMDVSPKQLVSVAASLVPFLENDDANRALMGSNMQRQAVPLLRARSPYVGTGMEYITARDSGAVVVTRRAGTVDYVDSQRIVVRVEGAAGSEADDFNKEMGADIYPMTKFKRSNQNTCINQRPIVRVGQKVAKGQVMADGPCTELGELALGRNVLVAFMPWRGYNFEDAILVSEKMVKEDYYTSIHIEEFEIEARDTKLGPGGNHPRHPQRLGDLPPRPRRLGHHPHRRLRQAGRHPGRQGDAEGRDAADAGREAAPRHLRREGRRRARRVAHLPARHRGHHRRRQDLLPQGHREGRPREGDRAGRARPDGEEPAGRNPHSSRRGEEAGHADAEQPDAARRRVRRVRPRAPAAQGHRADDRTCWRRCPTTQMVRLKLQSDDPRLEGDLRLLEERTERQVEVIRQLFEEKKEKIRRGDELPPGVIKLVKVYVAMKRKLSVGDKMAGRHGNKGVIARILPEEDMPYLPDGTPVEIVLNPLGVPSRMNVGQILETHLGWAAHALGLYFATPVFDGAREPEIKHWLDEAGLPKSGKTLLYDGMTGQSFEQDVTVGYIYMLKLSHLVDDKIHARSIGPYSLITQQPLGGKAQFGGQRFGEMEVWALEAYGSAHILQELLTAKSDDVTGRAKIYEAIVKGDASFTPGLPESFNVLIRELQSLCLDVELISTKRKPVEPLPADEGEPVLEQV